MMPIPPPPQFDPELAGSLERLRGLVPSTITPDMIAGQRLPVDEPAVGGLLRLLGVERRDVVIPGHDGGEVIVSIISRPGRTGLGPAYVHFHSGGMVMGTRFDGVSQFVEWAVKYNGIVVTVEYRLAPEFPDPYPVGDCYAALDWVASHLDELAVDPARLFVVGASAGGGLAAGVALLARDRQGPSIAGIMLSYPMLDDRGGSISTAQFEGIGVWDRISNVTGWSALLGDRRATDDVSIYAAPARAIDVGRLPPAYIEVGSAEVFRDETVAYASAIWASGGRAELHVWPGAFHACDLLAPEAAISREMRSTRNAWMDRMMLH